MTTVLSDFKLRSYPKVWNLGSRPIEGILGGYVIVQEKLDGSQIRWTWGNDGSLHVMSKNAWQYGGPQGVVTPQPLFQPAIEHLLTVDVDRLWEGLQRFYPRNRFTFYGETLAAPKHNVLAYNRVPRGNIALFDMEGNMNASMRDMAEPYNYKRVLELAANLMGVEAVPQYHLDNPSLADLQGLADEMPPMLGGDHVEGLVIKAYNKIDSQFGHIMMGKFVRPEFREKHSKEWKASKHDPIDRIVESLNTENRWRKAYEHLRDDGLLEHTPRDIGKLIAEVKRDVVEEEHDWIAEKLVEAFLPQIMRAVGRGLPEWYKQHLLKTI